MKCPKCKTDNSDDSRFCNNCGTSLIYVTNPPTSPSTEELSSKTAIDFSPGQPFGKRYQIIEGISRGKMGRIYKAMDKKLNKVVALMMINTEMSTEPWPAIVKRLKKGSLLAKDIDPDNVAKLYDMGEVDEIKYISMRYVEQESSKRPKKLIISLSAALIVIIGLAIFLLIGKINQKTHSTVEPGKKSIAVMYFENNTGDESLNHWRTALSDLLITDLSQSKYLRVLSLERLFNILSQLNQLETREYPLEVLQQVAEKGKVGYILLGSYSMAGDFFRINIKIQEANTGELIASEMVEAWGEEGVFAMVDELSRRIKANFEFSLEQIAGDIDKEVGKITSSSPEAYKYYSQGRRYHIKGDFQQSIQHMERAVAIDPEFAMAYRSMAQSYYNMGYYSEQNKYLQKALEFVERVSDRERYLIYGDSYLQSAETLDKAIEAYSKLLQLYPYDLIGNNNLGLLYGQLEKWDEAIERLEILKQLKDEAFFAYVNLSYIYMSKGSYDKAKEILHYYLNNFSDNPFIHRYLTYNYLCQRKYDLASIEVDKAISLDSNYFVNLVLKGNIFHLRGDLIKAEKEYYKLLELEEPIAHLEGRNRLGALYLLQGNFKQSEIQLKKGIERAKELEQKIQQIAFQLNLAYLYLRLENAEEALKQCHQAWNNAVEQQNLFSQRVALYCKALSYLELNSIDEATKTAEELKAMIEKGLGKKYMRYYHHLMGIRELKRHNFSQAIKYFEKALSLLPFQNPGSWILHNRHALFIDSLASAYYQKGEIERARKEYEKIIFLTNGRLFYGDIYAKSYYMLGKIYQQKGWEGKAIEHYERFLNLWKDADPDIPELIDARKQLKALQSK